MSKNQEVAVAEPIINIELFKGFEIDYETEEQRAELAAYVDTEIDSNMKRGLWYYVVAGYYLHVMKESKLWQGIGEHITSWADYIKKEKGISTGTDSNMRGTAQVFGELLEKNPDLLEIDVKRISEALTLFRRNKDVLQEYVQENSTLVLPSPQTDPQEVEEAEGVEAEMIEELKEMEDEFSDERRTEIQEASFDPADEDQLKEYILRQASVLPTSGWKDFIKDVRGETPEDSCLHEGEYAVLHRCLTCGKVYPADQGHSENTGEEYNELIEREPTENVSELKRIYTKLGASEGLFKAQKSGTDKWSISIPKRDFPDSPWYAVQPNVYSPEGICNLLINAREIQANA